MAKWRVIPAKRKAGDAAGQHASSAEAIDQEAGHGLADPETMKKTVVVAPMPVKLRPNPASAGGKTWAATGGRKCEITVHEADQGDDFEVLVAAGGAGR